MKNYFETKEKHHQEVIYKKVQFDPKYTTRAIVAKAVTSELTTTATAARPVVKRKRQREQMADRIDHTHSLKSRKCVEYKYASRE